MPQLTTIAFVILALTGVLASVLSALAIAVAGIGAFVLCYAAIGAPVERRLAEAGRLAVSRRRAALGYGVAPSLEQQRMGERRRALGYAK